jgi:hypothetical protein
MHLIGINSFFFSFQKLAAQRPKVLAEFDAALSRAGLPQPMMAGPFLVENAQTDELLTVRVATECCSRFTSKVSKNDGFRKILENKILLKIQKFISLLKLKKNDL